MNDDEHDYISEEPEFLEDEIESSVIEDEPSELYEEPINENGEKPKSYFRRAYEKERENKEQKESNNTKENKNSEDNDDQEQKENNPNEDDRNSEEDNQKSNNDNTEDNKKEKDEKNDEEKNNSSNNDIERNTAKNKIENLKNKAKGAKEKVDKGASDLYKLSHPLEYAKDMANDALKKGLNKVKDSAKAGLKNVGQKAVSGTGTLAKTIISNPYVLIILGICAVVLFILFLFSGASDSDSSSSSLFDANCEVFSIKTTTLTKQEFVEKADVYLSKRGAKAEALRKNLSTVYSLSIKNNINPELVVVRAVNEGFSPGDSKNNYWGMGCNNEGGYDACITYSSFTDGLIGFLENVSQYDNVLDMMSRYVSIGRYWYNPGSSSLGGCYYFPYVKEYMSEERARKIERICSSDRECLKGGVGDCEPTNEEDTLARTKSSTYAMANRREEIFGLPPDDCQTLNPNCTIYSQWDSEWAGIHLGNSSATMQSAGCAVTSIAIGLSCVDIALTVDNFSPKVLVQEMNAAGCFNDRGWISWNCSALSKIAPSLKYVSSSSIGGTASDKRAMISAYDPNKYIVITHFSNDEHYSHYVVFSKDIDNYTYEAKDPNGKLTNQKYSEIDQLIIYSYK